jgi:alkanesulfonate monooxygenase SsuD/methylene tetrahydromethanopterin reductase-like flavin-dependent oxidoreductase (luciferase family)
MRNALEMAREADEGGLWGLGIGDSQANFLDAYTVATACLARTTRLTVGPIVTNPVTRHWTVHAAAARSLSELAPGRFVLGMGSGNSSVRSIDATPAGRDSLVDAVMHIRENAPADVSILVSADGPRMARAAGECADGLVIGTGLDAAAIAHLRDVAAEARLNSRRDRPLELWLAVPLSVVESDAEVGAARARSVGVAITMARRAFARGLDGKNVPPRLASVLQERLPRYDMSRHASVEAANPNDELFADRPDVEEYLAERFGITGTFDRCRARIEVVTRQTGIDNFWFSTLVADPVKNVRLVARMFAQGVQA